MSTRKYIEERRQKKQRQNTILLIMMVGGLALVITALVLAFVTSNKVNIPTRQVKIPEFTQVEQSDFNGLGNPDAPLEPYPLVRRISDRHLIAFRENQNHCYHQQKYCLLHLGRDYVLPYL